MSATPASGSPRSWSQGGSDREVGPRRLQHRTADRPRHGEDQEEGEHAGGAPHPLDREVRRRWSSRRPPGRPPCSVSKRWMPPTRTSGSSGVSRTGAPTPSRSSSSVTALASTTSASGSSGTRRKRPTRRRTRSSTALRKLNTFRGDSAFTTWLHRVTVNACYDSLRRKRRRPLLQIVRDEDDERPETSLPAPDHADQVVFSVDVARALLEVPEEFRVVLVMADVQDLPYDEIARVLEIPVGTVKSRVFRGRAALGRALGAVERGTLTRVTGVRGRGMNHPYELLADLVDGTLDEGDLAGVQAHLDTCPACRDDVAHATAGREAARSLPQAAAPRGAARRVVVAAGGPPGGQRGSPDLVPVGGRGRGRRGGRRDRDRPSQRRRWGEAAAQSGGRPGTMAAGEASRGGARSTAAQVERPRTRTTTRRSSSSSLGAAADAGSQLRTDAVRRATRTDPAAARCVDGRLETRQPAAAELG